MLSGLKTCGVQPDDQAPGVDMANEIQQALLKFQSENITSVILLGRHQGKAELGITVDAVDTARRILAS